MKSILEKHKIVKVFAFLCLFSFGCSSSFLEYDQRGVQTKASFYKTDAQALEALMAAFDQWQGNAAGLLFRINAFGDEVYAGGGGRGDASGSWEEVNEYRFTPASRSILQYYTLFYTAINRSNLVIGNVETDSPNKILYVAMAKALRATSYFYLVNLYGDVPLVLEELGAEVSSAARTPKAEVYAQIEKDLSEAIAVLPLRSAMPVSLKQLLSKGSVQAMLGKAYLYQKKYSEAAAMFENIITSNEYSLYPDYTKVLRKDSEFGVESLWELSFITTLNYSGTTVQESFGMTFLSPRPEFLPASVFPKLGLHNFGWGFMQPHKEVYDTYVSAGDLIRRKTNIISPDELEALGGKYMNPARTGTPYGNDGYLRLNYVGYLSEGGGSTDLFKLYNNGTNFRMIRYADVLLMAAEAQNRKSTPDDAKAKTYLNLVRSRVQLPAVTSTGTDLFAAIKLERRLELAFESNRYFDLQRWGDAYATLKDQGKSIPNGAGGFLNPVGAGYKQGKNEFLPIPAYEITVNPEMTQNPGY